MTAETLTATFRLGWEGQTLQTEVVVPAGPTRPRVLLPMVRALADDLIRMGEAVVRDRGEAVSCRAGCAACCRHLVPLAESEARHLAEVAASLPEPLRGRVADRFATVVGRLATAGLLASLRDPADGRDSTDLGVAYLRLGLACPFLENERCAVYADRPLACRDYLVTSPAENCDHPTIETIRRVPTPGWVMTAFAALDGPPPPGATVRWVPLPLALEWADAHPEPPPEVCGPDLFGRFMTALTKQKTPTPAGLVAPEAQP